MPVEYAFDDHVVLVTGATGALGSAVTRAFAAADATVCGTDRTPPDDPDAHDTPASLHFYEADLTNEADVERVIDHVTTDHDQLDVLCNIAGTWRGGTPIEDTDLSTYRFLFDVNLTTMFLTSKHALSHLQTTHGSIVSVSAQSALEGGKGDGPYRASKAGVRLLTETIAEENTGTVRANAILPSIIDTPMNREMMPDADHDTWVAPDDIAQVILFLCSPAADPISGAAVPV